MVSGKSETASEAGGWTFSRFIVEDRRIGGSGGARSSAPLLRTLVLQRQKALFDPLEMSQHGGAIRIGQIRQHDFFASGQFLTDFCRLEECRIGKECGSTCRLRCSQHA